MGNQTVWREEDRDHLIDCKSCRHGVKWHHDGSQPGCQYLGVGPDRCACPLTHDEAATTHVAVAVAEERERIARVLLDGMPDPAFDSRHRDGYAAAIFMVERLAKGLKP